MALICYECPVKITDQKLIYLFLGRKGFCARWIHGELEAVLEEQRVGYSTVTKDVRPTKFEQSTGVQEDLSNLSQRNETDEAILEPLNIQPFSSVRKIARMILLPPMTVYLHLTQSLHFVSLKTLECLKSHRREKTASKPKSRRRLVASLNRHRERKIATSDEAECYLCTDYERTWTAQSCDPPARERKMIGSSKLILTVVRSRDGFHLIDALAKGMNVNADYHIPHIHTPREQMLTAARNRGDRKLIAHADQARPHTAKRSLDCYDHNFMKRASHLPFHLIWSFRFLFV